MNTVFRGIIYTALSGFILFSIGCKSPNIGLDNNQLKPCPDSPNCVSSYAQDTSHYVEPIRYDGILKEAEEKLVSIIDSTKRVRIVTIDSNYIHVEFTSMIFRFVDDVEFYFDEKEPLIHVRSASRVGYSDLGANRKRVEQIRKKFNK